MDALAICYSDFDSLFGISSDINTSISVFIGKYSSILDEYRMRIAKSEIDKDDPSIEDYAMTLFPFFIGEANLLYRGDLHITRIYSALTFLSAFVERKREFSIEEQPKEDYKSLISSLNSANPEEISKILRHAIAASAVQANEAIQGIQTELSECESDPIRSNLLHEVDIQSEILAVFHPSIKPQKPSDNDSFDIEAFGDERVQKLPEDEQEEIEFTDFINASDFLSEITPKNVNIDLDSFVPQTLADYKAYEAAILQKYKEIPEDLRPRFAISLSEFLLKPLRGKLISLISKRVQSEDVKSAAP